MYIYIFFFAFVNCFQCKKRKENLERAKGVTREEIRGKKHLSFSKIHNERKGKEISQKANSKAKGDTRKK